jgi:exonuclease SbcC
MISYLRLTNFRKHVDTEIRFEDTDQVVLISGQNGAGKSTIFEAVQYALYGEGRNGRTNVERLVRKGGEIEGMEVELIFSVAGVQYQVKRRRDNKMTSAVLWANDVAITEGPREVTAEVTKLLAMDIKGFRLAAYAQQRELDGLASMRPADRGQMLSRLLRLDVISRAKETARGEFRQRRDVLRALNDGVDIDEIRSRITEIDGELESKNLALTAARESIVMFDAEIAAGNALESAYQSALTNQVRLSTLLSSTEVELLRLRQELTAVVVPELIQTSGETIEALQNSSREVERRIADGESLKQQLAQLKAVTGELSRCESRLDELDRIIAAGPGDPASASAVLILLENQLEEERGQLLQLREEHAGLKERREALARAVENAEGLDAECTSCGQVVPEAHKHDLVERHHGELAAVDAAIEEIVRRGGSLRDQVDATDGDVVRARQFVQEQQQVHESYERASGERTDVLRRRDVYVEQVERLKGGEVDLSSLYAERARIGVAMNLAAQARERVALRTARQEQHDSLERSIQGIVERLEREKSALAESVIGSDLELAHERRQLQVDARNTEQDIASGLQADVAGAVERHKAAAAELEKAESSAKRRAGIDKEAQVSWWTSQVLEQVESTWAQQIKPSLEGTVSELASRLSDGRFDTVSFDTEYNVSVRDGGVMRQITDLSGGEIDLISLAVRLGLSSVVSERHGSGGIGFLILDECFGSQDTGRRTSIMNALRNLKSSHGQIFLISHVGGLEDSADAVVDVELDELNHSVVTKS